MNEKVSAIIFDMDGVLFDSEAVYEVAWRKAAREQGLSNIDFVHKKTLGMGQEGAMAVLQAHYGRDFDANAFWKYTSRLAEEYEEKNTIPLKPYCKEILAYLSGKGYRLAVASSSAYEWVEKLLKRAGLYSYFSEVLGGDEIKNAKPAPDIYKVAVERLGIEAEHCVAVEDSPSGILSAHAAGVRCVMVPDRIEAPKNIKPMVWKLCDSLWDLRDFL